MIYCLVWLNKVKCVTATNKRKQKKKQKKWLRIKIVKTVRTDQKLIVIVSGRAVDKMIKMSVG